MTPFGRSDALSRELGVELWVKDETGNVAGSHKARHLATILLHLRAAEQLGLLTSRAPLAIASCGNAAIAAATLAQSGGVAARRLRADLDERGGRAAPARSLGARIHPCERRAERSAGRSGDARFREAVAAGAIPFTVQGPENALVPRRRADAGLGDRRQTLAGGRARMASARPGGWGSAGRLRGRRPRSGRPARHRAGRGLRPAGRRVGPDRRADRHPERDWSQVMRAVARSAFGRGWHPRRRDLRLDRRRRCHAGERRASDRRRRGRHRASPPTRRSPPGSTSVPRARPGWPACWRSPTTLAAAGEHIVVVMSGVAR